VGWGGLKLVTGGGSSRRRVIQKKNVKKAHRTGLEKKGAKDLRAEKGGSRTGLSGQKREGDPREDQDWPSGVRGHDDP